jgi:hypothetical protein
VCHGFVPTLSTLLLSVVIRALRPIEENKCASVEVLAAAECGVTLLISMVDSAV